MKTFYWKIKNSQSIYDGYEADQLQWEYGLDFEPVEMKKYYFLLENGVLSNLPCSERTVKRQKGKYIIIEAPSAIAASETVRSMWKQSLYKPPYCLRKLY